MAQSLKNFLNRPIIVILGSTGTGKSKLGIELAKKANGEIISADSMQVYKGLDIITNKVTVEEQHEISHHLINIVKPPLEFSVTEFQKRALDVIQGLHKEDKVPIIVGGTNYYIESLLWNFLIDDDEEDETSDRTAGKEEAAGHGNICSNTKDLSLFEKLKSVDPERAAMLHPNNVRKISRSLQIFHRTGKKHSKLLEEQKTCNGSSKLGGPLRFKNVLVFWLTCNQEVLNKRLCDRADSMVKKGLVKEIADFYESYKSEKYESMNLPGNDDSKQEKDTLLYEEGLFQAIGFKEFHDYFTTNPDHPNRDSLLQQGLDSLKRVTVKYSKKQKCWINNRFLGRPEDSSPNVYELDTTELNLWETNVYKRALKITEEFLSNNGKITFKPMMRKINNANAHKKYFCDVCGNKIIMGDDSWQRHLTSRLHRRSLKRKRELDKDTNEEQ